MKKLFYILLILFGFFTGCRQRYDPPLNSLPNSFLVVEGVLNAAQDSTTVHLTRTFKLEQTATIRTENNAQLTVEGKDNTISSLTETGNGNYVSGNLHLNPNNEYRLRIKTTDGKEYLSDYVKVKLTPPIDSIGWDRSNEGLQIYVNTKDPLNATRYYRWEYEETWEIHSSYFSYFVYENGIVRPRQLPAENVYTCWKYNNSSDIILANSNRLQDDIIYKGPITLISPGDERLGERYSILVREYSLEREAYDFFELIKKNTQDIGSLFSPQPSEIRGNIHCINNPAEFVIGYVSVSSIQKKRIFISSAEVPQWGFSFLQGCPSVKVALNPDSVKLYFNNFNLVPYDIDPPLFPTSYKTSTPDCLDCRVRGGKLLKPSYW